MRLRISVVLSFVIAQLLVSVAAEAASIRNVILIIADDMNVWPTADGKKGDPYSGAVDSPNLDALARRGYSFQRAYANAPLCSPSRASFLSGRTPFETQVFDNLTQWGEKLVPSQTLPGVMKSSGFSVGLFGKVFHGWLPEPFRQVVSDEYLMNTNHFSDRASLPYGGPANYPETEHGDFINTSAAIDFIGRHKTSPFFMALGLFKPHAPTVVPAKYFERYADPVVRPPSLPNDLADTPPHVQLQYNRAHEAFLTCSVNECWDIRIKGYLASISFADAMIGRLVQAINDSGLSDSTAIVVIGDNGLHLGEKTILGKNTLWEEAVRVPMIIVDPTRQGGATVPAPVQLLDIYPTILQLVGVPVPDWASGVNLAPWLTTPSTPGKAVVSSVLDSLLVHTSSFSYMRHGDGGEEFYDLVADPLQLQNGSSTAIVERERMAALARRHAKDHRLFLADAGALRVIGTPLNDTLSGGSDNMVLAGGAGDDVYIVHNETVHVREDPGQGADTIIADTGYRLPPGVETLYLNALLPNQVARGNDLANTIEVIGHRVTIHDGGGQDVMRSYGKRTWFMLTPQDYAVDIVFFRSELDHKIDLRRFGASQTCLYDRGILTVNGEQVARIFGDFVIERDVTYGCSAAGTPFATASAANADVEPDDEVGPDLWPMP